MPQKATNWLVDVIRKERKEQQDYIAKKPSKSKRKQARLLQRRIASDKLKAMSNNEIGAIHKASSKARTNAAKFEASDSFLETYEWRRVRMEAIKLHGARCQCCGATPKDGIKINVDHIKPRKTHPELALALDNLQVLCNVCNHGKGNWDQTDWRSA